MAEKQVMESRKVKMGTAAVIFNVIGYILVGLVALICLLPFIMLVSGSFSSEQAIRLPVMACFPKTLHWKPIKSYLNIRKK